MTLENDDIYGDSGEVGGGGGGTTKKLMLDPASILALFPKEEMLTPDEIPSKKGKYGRPKKQPAFSSYRCYEERDIEFFIHQISDNEPIYDRKHSLNFDAGYIHATFDKIEACCQFLSRKNGENASRLWTELASEYKRERARLENLPSGAYNTDFEPRFPFIQQMWFLEQENSGSTTNVDLKISPESCQEKNGGINGIGEFTTPTTTSTTATTTTTNRKRAIDANNTNTNIDRLDDSINRLIEVMNRKSEGEVDRKSDLSIIHSDLIEHILKFFENVPRDRHLEIKCKIVMFLEKLKT